MILNYTQGINAKVNDFLILNDLVMSVFSPVISASIAVVISSYKLRNLLRFHNMKKDPIDTINSEVTSWPGD
jgi:hypothetical protein